MIKRAVAERPEGGKGSFDCGRAALTTLVVVGLLAGFFTLYMIRSVLFLFLIAILLATAIEPLVFRLRRGRLSHSTGVLLIYSALMALMVGIGALVASVVVVEASTFRESMPRMVGNLRELAASIDGTVLAPTVEKALAQVALPSPSEDDGAAALTIGLTVVEAIFSGLTVFVVAYYWLAERVTIKRAFTGLFPRPRRRRVGTIWGDVEDVMGSWVRGQLLLMLFVGVISAVGYTVLGLKYALVLAVLAALFEVVPLIGPYLGAIPALFVALTQDVRLALFVAAFIVVLQLVESNVLVPRLMASTVGVSPLTVMLGILIGATLAGISGALIAVPVAAALQVILGHVLPDAIEDSGLEPAPAAAPELSPAAATIRTAS